ILQLLILLFYISCDDTSSRPGPDGTVDASTDADEDAEFPTGITGRWWEEVPPEGERWEPRAGFAALVFDGRLWVMGGMVNRAGTPGVVNDVWATSDGLAWELVKPDDGTGWCARANFAAFVADGKMWVTGGNWDDAGEPAYESDAWWSVDGVHWTRALESHWPATGTAWGDRKGHAGVAFEDRMLVIGGADTDALADVWASTDGADWERLTLSGEAWAGRAHHTAAVHRGQVWVLGGQRGYTTDAFDDVLVSSDGADWRLAGTLPGPVYGHATVVYDAGLWVLGGQGPTADGSRVWHAADGAVWTAEVVVSPFPPRWYHQAAVFLGNLWVLGGAYQEGMGLGLRNDVWRLSPDNYR
ncbi:hypothetical protein KKC22_17135, partial [Myxococcota bacterium]|nr:hypothetical protein [Myxococcota bacterium]